MASSVSCPHLSSLTSPRPDQSVVVHREECTQCFDGQDGPHGVDVCLTCFNGACHDPQDKHHDHSSLHFSKTRHPIIVNIKRTPKVRADEDDERPKKLTKLEIVAEEPESERFDFHTKVVCQECNIEIPSTAGDLPTIIPAVLCAQTMQRQSDIQAFSFDLQPCEHVFLQQQLPNTLSPEEIAARLSRCFSCDLRANLWLCLECGNVACGRKQFGGEGLPGNGHALEHYNSTKHPVAVKLGSITADGKADVYCYVDDDEIIDHDLASHLAHWGVDITKVVVTEKSLAEMQLDLQYKYSFNMSTSTGEPLQPVFGPGLTGLQNLGNSCYVASIIQALFSIPEWKMRYNTAFELHHHECTVPYEGEGKGACLECQMAKICNGLVSGRYSIKQGITCSILSDTVTVHPDGGKEESQLGIRPQMLKSLIGRGHAEFAGTKQQDAQEFLIWLLSRIQRQGRPTGCVEQKLIEAERQAMTDDNGWGGYVDPTHCFKFAIQQRIQCLGCGGVKYRVDQQDNMNISVPDKLKPSEDPEAPPEFEPVEFENCIKTFTAKTEIDLTCTHCGHKSATMQNGFLTLPDVLVVTATRFVLKNWVPTKLDVPLIVPETPLSFDRYIVQRGIQPGENPLPDAEELSRPSLPPLNETAYAQLQEMGFPANRAEKALRTTGNSSTDVAMQWLFEHMEDPDIDAPYVPPEAGSAAPIDEEAVNNLAGMGFDPGLVKKALRQTGGDMERAVDWLFSHPDETADPEPDAFDSNANALPVPKDAKVPGHLATPAKYQLQSVVMHKGSSVHAGHYVAFIKKEIPEIGEDWVLINDEKVVRGGDWKEVQKTGYVYFFRRC